MSGTDAIERWMQAYLKAWASDASDDIRALFTEDARYYPHPFEDPWTPLDGIVEQWIHHGDSTFEWSFEYEVLADADGLAFVRGVTTYPEDDEPEKVYSNLWVVRLEEDGRASEFREWWMKKRS
jgi:ketosteroid isomerase-like protein